METQQPRSQKAIQKFHIKYWKPVGHYTIVGQGMRLVDRRLVAFSSAIKAQCAYGRGRSLSERWRIRKLLTPKPNQTAASS